MLSYSQYGLVIAATTNGTKDYPVVDSSGKIHIYQSSVPLRLDNDYALYCMEHYHWETISVRYNPTVLSKLRKEEYIVRRHPKSS